MNPHSLPPELLRGKKVEEMRSKVKFKKKGGVGRRCFQDLVFFLITLL